MITPITDPEVLAGYLTDASNVHGHCEALVRPRTTTEVAEVVRHCQSRQIGLTITAGRTSTVAGPVPFGGWLLSTERLTRVLAIEHHRATAQAGVWLGQLQTRIEATGRLFPPDPTSRHECTLGAAIACNASGARSFRYGPTRPWVERLTVVLPTGAVLDIGPDDPIPPGWPTLNWAEPPVKTAAGYAPSRRLIDLFIGQEGTLGIITEATVRLTELPEKVIGLMAYFPTRQAAQSFMERARSAARSDPRGALSPRCLEYFDHACLAVARGRVGGVPDRARAALFCEQEVTREIGEQAHIEAWWRALLDSEALAHDTLIAADRATHEALLALRHAVPAGLNERAVANHMPKVGTDLAVPDAALRIMMDAYEAVPLTHALFGHMGDNHLHLNLLPSTQSELAQAKQIVRELSDLAIGLGGTVSAEHGIGKTKRELLESMVGSDVLAQFRALKKHLDPGWILGRGSILEA